MKLKEIQDESHYTVTGFAERRLHCSPESVLLKQEGRDRIGNGKLLRNNCKQRSAQVMR